MAGLPPRPPTVVHWAATGRDGRVQSMTFSSGAAGGVFPRPIGFPVFGGVHPLSALMQQLTTLGGAEYGPSAASEEDVERIAAQLYAAQQPRETPTSAAALRALPSVTVSASHVAAKLACSVCQDCFVEGDSAVLELPCHHLFHSDCILPWLDKHNSCPDCRALLPAASSSERPAAAAPAPADPSPIFLGGGSGVVSFGPAALFSQLNRSGIFFDRAGGLTPSVAAGLAPPRSLETGDDSEDDGDGDGDPELAAAIAASIAEEEERQMRAQSSSGRVPVSSSGNGGASLTSASSPASGGGALFSQRVVISPEPLPTDGGAFTLRLRFPDATSVVRRFPPEATLEQVAAFVMSTDKRPLFSSASDGTPRLRFVARAGGAAVASAPAAASSLVATPGAVFAAENWDVALSSSGLERRVLLLVERV
jgi:hypothetical protein